MKTQSFILAAFAAAPCLAQTSDNPPTALDPMVVTATRSEQRLSEIAASVHVIGRADIERLQPRDLPDLLRSLPGVAVVQNGGRGQLTSVFLRGNESRHTLVLINGHRAGSVELPGFAFEYLPVESIERIEIVQGPRSSLYGSQAFGGVINIITRSDTQTSLSARGGNHHTGQVAGHTGYADGRFSVSLDAGAESTRGYNVTTPANFGFNPDDDGHRARRVGAGVKAPLADTVSLSLDSQLTEGTTEFDEQFNEFRLDTHHAGFEFDLGNQSLLMLDAGLNREQRDFDQPFNFGFFSDSERRTASAQFTKGFSAGSNALVGFDFAEDRYTQQGAMETERISRAGFLNLRPRFGALLVELGGRYEEDNAYGSISTGQLGLRYALTEDLDVFAHGGSAFRAPTFQERFGGPFNVANPSLQPEETFSYEAGTEWHTAGLRAAVSAYESRVRDLITFNSLGADAIPFSGDEFYENVARTRIRGGELRTSGSVFDTQIGLGLGYTDARNQDTNAPLARRPRKTARLDLDRRWNRLSYGLTLSAESKRPDGSAVVPGFTLLNLRAGYAINRSLDLSVSVRNALERDYTTVNTYQSEPINVLAGLTWRL